MAWPADAWSAGPSLWRSGAASLAALALAVGLAACGGSGGGAGSGGTTPTTGSSGGSAGRLEPSAATADAVRLAQQASFGPTEALVAQIRSAGSAAWVSAQMATAGSVYAAGGGDGIHRLSGSVDFCDLPRNAGDNCWRDNHSAVPLVWDFYRNAVEQPDQLRQRVAFALAQILVVSGHEVSGTYGLRRYHNRLLELAFGNYRDVLRSVTLSPVMGDYLNHVNNNRTAPNENYARELLQLFSIGTCVLGTDGRAAGSSCQATYDNARVRAYAYALTGWTYPPGGTDGGGCWPRGTNCRYYNGDMVPLPALRDDQARELLSGVSVPAGATAELALERVLDSLMAHPNMAPFLARQLIQHLVSANPSAAYVQRVAQAFDSGRFERDGQRFGDGRRGDLAASIAAILLDDEARGASASAQGGRLREPALMFTGVLRALNGRTDGDALGWWWGETLAQMVFMAPSVFNFYPPDYPVAGTDLVGPTFGIHNASTGVTRLNFLTYLLYWGGSQPNGSVPGALGTRVQLAAYQADASDPGLLVDRLSMLAYGDVMKADTRKLVVDAVAAVGTQREGWAEERVKQAAFLIFGSPRWQVLQ
jgi:uncharacterized protein (DUF1800 family)